MAEELTRATPGWSAQAGESRFEGDPLHQMRWRLLGVLIFPGVPVGLVAGIFTAVNSRAWPAALITAVLSSILCYAVAATLRLMISSGLSRIDGEVVYYKGNMWDFLRVFLITGSLTVVTLGIYWILGFNAVAVNKVKAACMTRSPELEKPDRSGFFGNFLHIIVPKIVVSAVPIIIMCMTGLIPIRETGEDFLVKNQAPTMKLGTLFRAVIDRGLSALGENGFYNEVTTLLWTSIMLFVACFILVPWYRHKMMQWENSHTSVDGYRLKYDATFGQYFSGALLSLLMTMAPIVLIIVLIVKRRRLVPAVWFLFIILLALSLVAILAYTSYRAAKSRAKFSSVLKPPSPQAPWDVYMVSQETLSMSFSQSVRSVFNPEARKRAGTYTRRYWSLYALLIIPIVYFIVFKYIPMLFIQIGVKQNNIVYNIWDVPWSKNYGFEWFLTAFKNADFKNALRSTLVLNGLDLIVGFPAPIILAILLNELSFKRFKRLSQTIFYMPHFLSWVIISSLALSLFNPTNGLVNMALDKLKMGSVDPFYSSFQWVVMYCLLGVWQGAGWGTIIYLAAITNINPELYEAAEVDGAGRLRKIWHVTLPGLRPTIIILLIMRMGSIIGSDFERPYALKNGIVAKWSDVISIFVYEYGLRGNKFALSSAVGIFQSVICLFFLFAANALAKKFGERGVW